MPSQHGFALLHFVLLVAGILRISKGITPQMFADNLKCNSYDAETLILAAQHTVSKITVVGQEASPNKCGLLGTSKNARKRMTASRNTNAGCFLAFTLGVRDLLVVIWM